MQMQGSNHNFEAVTQPIVQDAISQGVFSGCVLGVVHGSNAPFIQASGSYGEGDPMQVDSIFDIASVTKSIPVSTLALKRILAGSLDLHGRVMDFIPELQVPFREQIQVWHLLTHSLDYRFPMSSLKNSLPEEIWTKLMNHPFQQEPGASFSYGNAASLILGVLLERLTEKELARLAEEELFSPLQMVSTGWNPLARYPLSQIVSTEICPWRNRVIRGEVHDESACAMKKPVGSAGVFSTVPDLLRFMTMMLQDGVSREGVRVLPAGVLSMVTQNALPHVNGQGTALGWELANRKFMGKVASDPSFGKTGFTGASVVCDPLRNMAVVFLTNFTWPQREATVERIYEIRRRIHDALFSQIPVE